MKSWRTKHVTSGLFTLCHIISLVLFLRCIKRIKFFFLSEIIYYSIFLVDTCVRVDALFFVFKQWELCLPVCTFKRKKMCSWAGFELVPPFLKLDWSPLQRGTLIQTLLRGHFLLSLTVCRLVDGSHCLYLKKKMGCCVFSNRYSLKITFTLIRNTHTHTLENELSE